MNIKNIAILIVFAIQLFGCKKYLEEEPRRQASVQTADQLEAILNNNTIFVNTNIHNPHLAYSTDDTEIPMAAYLASPTTFSIDNLLHYSFDVTQIPTATADPFWNREYSKILHANMVLETLGKVTGSAEQKQQLEADARMIRAFSFWILASSYCLPWSESNAQELGLPLKNTTDYGELVNRATLGETYSLIERELLTVVTLAKNEVDPRLSWRASKRGAEGMLSRLYLEMNMIDKSLEFSNAALTSTTAQLMDYNTLRAGTPQVLPPAPGFRLEYSELNDWGAPQFLFWKEFLYTRFYYSSSQWQMPSTNLLALYDQVNDMRFKWFMIPNGNRRFLIASPTIYRYTIFNDGRYLPLGPTVSEMLLNKAEAHARKGELGAALAAVNLLRPKRMKDNVAITAATPQEALVKILEERRREMPFTMRWNDIRRFSVNDDPTDDVTVNHTFFEINNRTVNTSSTKIHTLAPGSRRFAVPINNLEIINSQDAIKQNTY